jgi:hypothetical protein
MEAVAQTSASLSNRAAARRSKSMPARDKQVGLIASPECTPAGCDGGVQPAQYFERGSRNGTASWREERADTLGRKRNTIDTGGSCPSSVAKSLGSSAAIAKKRSKKGSKRLVLPFTYAEDDPRVLHLQRCDGQVVLEFLPTNLARQESLERQAPSEIL